MKHGIGKVERFSETFESTRRIQGTFHWSHIRIAAVQRDSATAKPATEGPRTSCKSKHEPGAEALLAVVASKKLVDKRAVHRNRAKRRLRPIMTKLTREWLDCQRLRGADSEAAACSNAEFRLHWIVRPKKSAITATAQELEHDVRRVFEEYVNSWNANQSSATTKRATAPLQRPQENRTGGLGKILHEARPHTVHPLLSNHT